MRQSFRFKNIPIKKMTCGPAFTAGMFCFMRRGLRRG